MKTREIEALSQRCLAELNHSGAAHAYAVLAPTLAARTPFTLLDRLGQQLSAAPNLPALLYEIAAHSTIGGWPVIGSALQQHLATDLSGTLTACRAFIITGDVWHSTDNLGERVIGPALVKHFAPALKHLRPWRADENHWVRRSLGVGVHVWAKRARGAQEKAAQAKQLLAFLKPLFPEQHIEAVKGIGWGLKTLGRYYPELTTAWLADRVWQVRYRELMLQKALTYLSESQQRKVFFETFRIATFYKG